MESRWTDDPTSGRSGASYERLTGQRAFENEDTSLTLSKALRINPAFDALLGAVPASVTQALRVCLHKDLCPRASDIRDVRLALEGAFSPPRNGNEADQTVTAPRLRLPTSVAVALALLAAGLAASTAWVARPGPTRFGNEVIRLSIPLSFDERFRTSRRAGVRRWRCRPTGRGSPKRAAAAGSSGT